MKIGWNVAQYASDTQFQMDLDRARAVTPGCKVRLDAVNEYISTPNSYNWSDLDRKITAVVSRGLVPHLMVPYWTPGANKSQPAGASAIDQHVRFCRALGLRYRTQVPSAELGNECNRKGDFATDGAKPELQAQIATLVAEALPAEWTLVSPGMAPAPSSAGSLSPLEYLKRFWPIAGHVFQACAVHPYGRSSDADELWSVLGQLPAIHSVVGCAIWASEYNSWHTPDAEGAQWVAETLPWMAKLRDNVGHRLVRRKYVSQCFIYAMSDPGTEGSDHLGVYDSAGNPRPVLAAIQRFLGG